ncbi:MAG TPA: valine--tRNA ligase [Bacteroidales bacterium]|nr:valine--tRNA ligase [Bacteroidales bacterium]HSA44279.1 valine--tRNA ligase [Bacteroidales bacterium]
MEIAPKYDPLKTETRWYQYWLDHGFFHAEPDDREAFCIVIPPPNVTGVLHMGHMLNNTIQDVLVRRARMQGKNTLWLPGTDHASIATEAKVVEKLKQQGIDKASISREEFLDHAWEWKEKHGGIILEQLKRLGASCDWNRTRFTMDPEMSRQVITVFVDLYNKGLIYKGVRMVNWDPKALTAISDEEVNYREVQSKLYYVRYQVEGEADLWITIATTRPETILGDTAVCVHPEDPRYSHLHGKKVLVPLINRAVPLIQDEYVDREFGTGALKVTPAHDINDYMLGEKYRLDSVDIFNDDGSMSEAAILYTGEDRFAVREKIVEDLKAAGNLVKIEDYVNKVGYSERTHVVIEPRLSTQWFLRMPELTKPALEVVMNDTVRFHPAKFKNTYRHWMENVKDWCISRQLWWGHRIPVWYLPEGAFVVATDAAAALELARERYPDRNLSAADLSQDEDVLDTWFSSWLWPISVFNGITDPENDDIRYYYPTNDLVTAPEILFFWVARMIMAGLEYRGEIPFRNVYLTGIVRDKLGRKMSKSLGNSADPIELMERYGADGVRVGMLLTSPAGNDLPFDEELCEQGRNFSNKVWNALRLVKGWKTDPDIPVPEASVTAVRWFEARFNQVLATIEDHYAKYRLSDALMTVYKLIWDDFCSWYLEMIKPAYQQPIDLQTYQHTIRYFEKLMQVLHPFMPFITEEVWQLLQQRTEGESIMVSSTPEAMPFQTDILREMDNTIALVVATRRKQAETNIKQSVVHTEAANGNPGLCEATFTRLTACTISYGTKPAHGLSFLSGSVEFHFELGESVNREEEIEKLRKDLAYYRGFLQTVTGKLSNEKFVNGAPKQVVENELKKKEDAETKIRLIEKSLELLSDSLA